MAKEKASVATMTQVKLFRNWGLLPSRGGLKKAVCCLGCFPTTPSMLFDILYLLPHLLQFPFQVHCEMGNGGIIDL